MSDTIQRCEYFLLCTNEAEGYTKHPVLDKVPTCQRCADQVGATLIKEEAPTPKCDMTADCKAEVTHIDQDGFVYCTYHGLQRRQYQPCRKLRPFEVKRLRRGEQVKKY